MKKDFSKHHKHWLLHGRIPNLHEHLKRPGCLLYNSKVQRLSSLNPLKTDKMFVFCINALFLTIFHVGNFNEKFLIEFLFLLSGIYLLLVMMRQFSFSLTGNYCIQINLKCLHLCSCERYTSYASTVIEFCFFFFVILHIVKCQYFRKHIGNTVDCWEKFFS